MIDIKEIRVLNQTGCLCGKHQFTLADLTKLERLTDAHGFYGNLIKTYSITHCPNCGREVILLMRQKGQTWEIMNTAKRDIPEMIVKNAIEEITTGGEQSKIDLEQQTRTDNEFICPECKRAFKSKSGLTNHMKTHQN